MGRVPTAGLPALAWQVATFLTLSALQPAATARRASQPAARKPHIIMHLADDFGWANAGWHRPEGYEEVQTPRMDAMVKAGIELDQAYSYQYCSPTRSSLQSGRLPVHVNMINAPPTEWNPEDPVSGFQGIPRNMTGIATKLKGAGYRTHQVGKVQMTAMGSCCFARSLLANSALRVRLSQWDAGMATLDHTPHGRGYDTSFGYFWHANDYWTESVEQESRVPGVVDLYNETKWTTWAGPAPGYTPTDGPAFGQNGSCPMAPQGTFYPPYGNCSMTGPEKQYEEYKFSQRVIQIIEEHDDSQADHPLFLCYTSHIVHEPLQVPNSTWHQFDFIQKSSVGDYQYHRQIYQAMVHYLDGVVGMMQDSLQAKDMWENTLWFHQSDNGEWHAGGEPW